MAKKNQVFIDVVVDDKGTTKRVAVNAKKLGIELENAGVGAGKAAKGTDDLSKRSDNLNRNLRGTAKMSSNATKNFSKMQQGTGGLVGAYATLAAQVFAVSAAFQFLQSASELRNLIAGQEALGSITGVAYKTITNGIIQATDAQLKYGEAARAAAIGTAAGLTSGQLTDLSTAAKNVSFALGRDLTDSFNRLIRGVTKAEPELLDELGIILRLEPATQKYAQAIGKTVGELNAFERTQAVANEVLEQTTRKFGKIEAMMDPNAAALSQFAKSFDELINKFKIGLIDNLRPILLFLSENTKALGAALALVALPIVKAIIPSMKDWQKSSRDTAKLNRRMSNSYKTQLREQADELQSFIKTQADAEKQATRIAKQRVEGKGTKPTAGLSYLMGEGEAGAGRQRQAARKILDNALADLENHREVQRGALQGWNKKEVQDLEKSYRARDAMTKAHSKKTIFSFEFIKQGWKGMTLSMKATWASTMQFISTTAAVAAGVISMAFNAIAIGGMLVVLFQAAKAIYRHFVPLSDEMKKQQKHVEELKNKYGTLTEEILRLQDVMKNAFLAPDFAPAIGNMMQSIDVKGVIDQINYASSHPRDLKNDKSIYSETVKNLAATVKFLAATDPMFKTLQDNLVKNKRLTEDETKAIIQRSNELINTAKIIESLPERYNAAATALRNLLKSSETQTPLSAFVSAQDTLVSGLEEQGRTTTENTEKLRLEYEEQKKLMMLNAHRAKAEQDLRKKMGGKHGFEIALKQLQDSPIYKDLGKLMGAEQLNSLVDRMETSGEISRELRVEIMKQTKILVRAKRLEGEMLVTQNKRKDAIIEATKLQSQGLTIDGKILNLETQRVKAQDKVVQAELNHKAALHSLNETAREGDKDAIFAASQKVIMFEKEVELQKLLRDLALEKINLTEEDLQKQKELLQVLNAQQKAQQLSNRLKITEDLVSKLGGGTQATATESRRLRLQRLQQDVIAAAFAGQQAAEAYTKEYRRRIKELMETGNYKLNEAKAQAREETDADEGVALETAKTNIMSAGAALTAEENIGQQLISNNQKRLEELQIRADTNYFNQEEIIYNEMLLSMGEKRHHLSEAELWIIKEQAKEQHALNQIIELKQGLANSIANNMASAFQSIVDGSMSAKQAFGQMAIAIIRDLTAMIIKMMVMRALMAAFGGSFGGPAPAWGGGGMSQAPTVGIGGAMPAKRGGIFKPVTSYATGGIARGREAGYPAILHGTEAVVPLPNNKNIPVEFLGGQGSQQNNVTVNVNVDNAGNSEESVIGSASGAENLGRQISAAVQQELQNQKRSGGILNPYGVA
tara:strand:+ start:484 stop:4422 length:3939 start_codon:yes stop_codon:yes gene_type:complete